MTAIGHWCGRPRQVGYQPDDQCDDRYDDRCGICIDPIVKAPPVAPGGSSETTLENDEYRKCDFVYRLRSDTTTAEVIPPRPARNDSGFAALPRPPRRVGASVFSDSSRPRMPEPSRRSIRNDSRTLRLGTTLTAASTSCASKFSESCRMPSTRASGANACARGLWQNGTEAPIVMHRRRHEHQGGVRVFGLRRDTVREVLAHPNRRREASPGLVPANRFCSHSFTFR